MKATIITGQTKILCKRLHFNTSNPDTKAVCDTALQCSLKMPHCDIISLCYKNIFCVEKQLLRPPKRWYLLMPPMCYSVNLLLFPFRAGVDVTPQVQPILVSKSTFAGSETVILRYSTTMNYLYGFWMLSMWILKNYYVLCIYMSFYTVLVLHKLAKANVCWLNILKWNVSGYLKNLLINEKTAEKAILLCQILKNLLL